MRAQRGFTLIELLLVIVLGVVAVGVAMRQYASSQAQADVDASFDRLQRLHQAITRAFPGGDYTGLSAAAMAAYPGTPPDLVSGTALLDRQLGTLTLAPAAVGGSNLANSAISVSFTKASKHDCVALAQRLAPQLDALSINGTVVADRNAGVDFALDGATTNCTTETNTMQMRWP